jgi:hypothetical protein
MVGQGRGDAGVSGLPLTGQQAVIDDFLHQGVPEPVTLALHDQQMAVDGVPNCRREIGLRQATLDECGETITLSGTLIGSSLNSHSGAAGSS